MARGQLERVVLIEVADADVDADVDRLAVERADDPTGLNPPGVPPRHLARGLGRWWPLIVALVVLLVLGAAIPGLRVRQRAARLADLPGVIAPVDAALHERWRARALGWGDVMGVGDRVVVFGRDAAGTLGLTALDGATGEQVWRTSFPSVTASGSVTCVPPDTDDAHVVCLVGKGVVPDGATRDPQATAAAHDDAPGAAPNRLVVLAMDTGRKVADRELRSDNTGVASFGSDAVVTEVLPDGRAAVTRQDPLTGAVRWEFRSPAPLRTPGSGPAWLYPIVNNGVIVANGPVTWAFAADGARLGEWHLQGGDWAVRGGWGLEVSVLPNGSFAVGEAGGVGLSDDDYGTVSTTDARDGFPIPGPVLDPVVDDGSAPNVLLTVPAGQGGLVALGAKTGQWLWSAGAASWGSALVLDGRVLEFANRELRAYDAQTGRQLWSLPVPMGNHAKQILTDGRLALVPQFDAERGAVITAVDPADGRVQWTAALPPRASRVAVVGGRMLVWTDRDLVSMG